MITIRFNRSEIDHTDHGCYQQRNPSVLRLFKHVWESMPKEELPEETKEFCVCTEDGPHPHPTKPFFTIAGTKENISRCYPCFVFDRWVEAHIDDFTEMITSIRTVAQTPPIDNRAFWIGASTHHTRAQLVALGRKHPNIIDARMMVWAPNKEFVTLTDHTKYKYLIEMQGVGFSARLKLLLHAKRLLFIQDRWLWDWVVVDLQPWVHYVPIKEDLTDLVEKINWADTHPEEVQHIIERCDKYALQYSTRERAYQQIKDLIKTL